MFAEIENDALKGLPFVLVSLRDSSKQPPVHRPQGFLYHQILWVTEGICTYRVGEETLVLSEGEGIYMRPHVPHSYEGKNLSTAWCTFTLSENFLDFLGIGDYLYFRVPPSLDRETEQLLRFALGDSTVLSRSAAGYSYVTDFFSKVLGEEESLSSKLRRILEKRYSEPLTLFDLAEDLRIDKYELCRRYRQEQGVTVMEELHRIRIQKAKQFLKYNAASVEEIGRLCGFESPSYFAMRFRRTVGCTPTEYRKRSL